MVTVVTPINSLCPKCDIDRQWIHKGHTTPFQQLQTTTYYDEKAIPETILSKWIEGSICHKWIINISLLFPSFQSSQLLSKMLTFAYVPVSCKANVGCG